MTASGSGLDLSIGVVYADLQIPRMARNTGASEAQVRQLVDNTSGAGIGVAGVNVLKLNLAVQAAVR